LAQTFPFSAEEGIMFSNILQAIEGIEVYQIISSLIFVPFFVGVVVYVVRMKKEDADRMSQLPLN
jgi:hypothetical protein